MAIGKRNGHECVACHRSALHKHVVLCSVQCFALSIGSFVPNKSGVCLEVSMGFICQTGYHRAVRTQDVAGECGVSF